MTEGAFSAAAAIRYCRTRAGLSARAASIGAGLGDSYVSRVEAGVLEPSLRAFARIAAVIGMSEREVGVVVANEATQPRRAKSA